VQPGEDVLRVLPPGDVGGDLRFGEHRARARDAHRPLRLQRERPDLPDVEAERVRADLEEPTGPGRALVVHGEVDDLPLLVDPDRLRVLAPDVDDDPGPREEEVGAAGVAGDLRHHELAEVHLVPAVTGPGDERHLGPGDPRVGQRGLEGPLRILDDVDADRAE